YPAGIRQEQQEPRAAGHALIYPSFASGQDRSSWPDFLVNQDMMHPVLSFVKFSRSYSTLRNVHTGSLPGYRVANHQITIRKALISWKAVVA
ncbi:MAG: hypothetical protein M3Z49_11160, partial [Bifidobacteriales bacterium]|nr:hypothetical protein [Bifidobacteriales bacterium]